MRYNEYIVCHTYTQACSLFSNQGANSPASWKCSEEYFSQQIKNRDPLKIGLVSKCLGFAISTSIVSLGS
ncbi:hypothetical protein C3L33_04130, partial [Rhododendron williamsianum]